MYIPSINWLAVIVAVIISFALGMFWYSPKIFGTIWMKLINKKMEDLKNPSIGYSVSLIGSIIASIAFAFLIKYSGATTLLGGLKIGALVAICIVYAGAVNTVFSMRPWKLFGIEMGYHAVYFLILGALFGFWN